MRLTRKYLLSLLGLIFIGPALLNAGNQVCGTDLLMEKALEKNPELQEIIDERFNYAQNYHPPEAKSDGPSYIIPVVVHVIHDNSIEKISREQVLSAIEGSNKDFRLKNTDKSNIVPAFRDIAADTRIELRLATRDPEGNPTDGIVYTESALTEHEYPSGSQNELMNLIEWDHTQYLNIYIVRSILSGGEISNIGGYAFLPFSAMPGRDGMVIRHESFGSTGTSDNNRTLTHELGHYLGLFHTFQGGCPDSGQNCNNSGDGICDTPPTSEAHFQCNTTRETCGNLDNIQNHMDYSSCRLMFTEGQRDVMHSYLIQGVRSGLHTQQNLERTGANSPIGYFTAEENVICKDETITFTNISANTDFSNASYEWHFEGGEPSVSGDKNPEVTYSEPGQYDVTLIVSNDYGTDTFRYERFVETRSAEVAKSLPFTEDFNDPDYAHKGWQTAAMSGGIMWQRKEGISKSGEASLMLNNYYASGSNHTLEFMLPDISFSGIENPYMYMKYAFATIDGQSNDQIRLLYSGTCGSSFSFIQTIRSTDLVSSDMTADFPFEPNENEWDSIAIPMDRLSGLESAWIKFRYLSGTGGNNFYIDEIGVFDADNTSLDSETEQLELASVYPNPFKDEINISFRHQGTSDVEIRITDLTGRALHFEKLDNVTGGSSKTFQAGRLNVSEPGIYLMEISVNGNTQIKKIGTIDR